MFDVTIRVKQYIGDREVGSWERVTQLHSVPRIGEVVYVDDYSWGEHIERQGAEVIHVCHGLTDGRIIVDVEDIKDRGPLHSADGSLWTEEGSVYYEDIEDAPAQERKVLIGFSVPVD